MKSTALMIILYMVKVQAECPSTCNCTATSVSCVAQNLESVPDLYELESSPVILDFSGNQLVFIAESNFDFPNIDEVKEIYLNNSGITDIGQGTFDNVENLQELYLGQNFLSKGAVPESLIEELDNMVLLDMSNNYFGDEMPVVRSNSLEVLALVNSKISSIPENALDYLPNLKLLLLQQNNIQYISFDVFKSYVPHPFFVKLSFNPWKCSCDNLKTFAMLGSSKYLDTSEPYQCLSDENKITNIFNGSGAIELKTEQCDNMDNQVNLVGYQEVRDMVDEDRKNLKNLEPQNETAFTNFTDTSYEYADEDVDQELDIKEMNDNDLDAALPGNCWEVFTDAYSNNGYFTIVAIVSVTSFFIGFIAGLIFCRIMYIFRYKKLEQSSDSQVQLLRG